MKFPWATRPIQCAGRLAWLIASGAWRAASLAMTDVILSRRHPAVAPCPTDMDIVLKEAVALILSGWTAASSSDAAPRGCPSLAGSRPRR